MESLKTEFERFKTQQNRNKNLLLGIFITCFLSVIGIVIIALQHESNAKIEKATVEVLLKNTISEKTFTEYAKNNDTFHRHLLLQNLIILANQDSQKKDAKLLKKNLDRFNRFNNCTEKWTDIFQYLTTQ